MHSIAKTITLHDIGYLKNEFGISEEIILFLSCFKDVLPLQPGELQGNPWMKI